VELINRVFSLHSHSIALEYEQFVDVLRRDVLIGTMAVENACDCVSENFLRTMLQDDIWSKRALLLLSTSGKKEKKRQYTC